MKNDIGMVEFRWHGRGGQGVKMACLLMAEVAAMQDKYVQGFPEYGPERMGAPITAYDRISDGRCTIHSYIYYPDYVIVVDETLLEGTDVTAGLKPDGAVLVNTAAEPGEIRAKLRGWEGRLYTLDARKISEEVLGRNFPNTPILGAAVKVSGILDEKQFLAGIEKSLENRFADKPDVVAGNMATVERAMREVQRG